MKTALLISLPAILALLGFVRDNGRLTTAEDYCNSRFDYCIQYDADILTRDVTNNENADGATLKNTDGTVEVEVYGAFNPLLFSLDELLAQNLKHFRDKSSIQTDDKAFVRTATGYSLTLKTPQHHIRQQLVRRADSYLVLTVKVRRDRPDLLGHVMETTRFNRPATL